jgi:hypothetical protein
MNGLALVPTAVCKSSTHKETTWSHGIDLTTKSPSKQIHAAQIFAEMLGAVCHPEFFDCTDMEVRTPSGFFDVDGRRM